MSYSIIYSENGVDRDISDFVTSVQYGGERLSAVRNLEVSLLSGTDANIPKLNLKKGSILTLVAGNAELIRAVIFKEDRDNNGNVKITAYTHGIYLTKNKDTTRFEQQKANQIAQKVCSDFGIPAGTIEDTKIILPKLLFREKTLWDIILTALTETTKHSGIKYRTFFKKGELNICKRQEQSDVWMLDHETNLLSASGSSSIEELKNRIKVTSTLPKNKKKELEVIVNNEKNQKHYGIMQETKEETGDGMTESKITQIANTMLKELCKEDIHTDVEALGIDGVEAGMAINVVEPISGLTGTYYIEQDDHSIEGNRHTMRLRLSLTDETPQLEYET